MEEQPTTAFSYLSFVGPKLPGPVQREAVVASGGGGHVLLLTWTRGCLGTSHGGGRASRGGRGPEVVPGRHGGGQHHEGGGRRWFVAETVVK